MQIAARLLLLHLLLQFLLLHFPLLLDSFSLVFTGKAWRARLKHSTIMRTGHAIVCIIIAVLVQQLLLLLLL